MHWLLLTAKVSWALLPLLAWLLLTLGILWAFPAPVVRELVLPQFPEARFFFFYGCFAVCFIATYVALHVLLMAAWSAFLRPSVSYEAQLSIAQGKYPPRAAIRKMGEFVVRIVHRRGNAHSQP